MRVDLAIVDARVATLAEPGATYGLIEGAVIGIRAGEIAAVGRAADIHVDADQTWSAAGRLVTPGLVDCHTHLVFGGDRVGEFERRLAGASYAELAASGGGILATVAATRAEDEATLLRSARRRLGWLTASGATTVEVKSGYGLDLETELRMLRVARRLESCEAVHISTSLLAAHTVPPEFAGRADAFIDHVCETILPAAARENLCDAVDAFCESIAFSPAQVERVFDAAARLGLPVKLHADQLSDWGGARLAARHRALSADHLEHLGPGGAAALAEAGTTAVLLPGASAFLGEAARPPVEALRAHGVPMAIATDLNPGSAPLGSLTLAMNLACTRFGLRPDEALAGTTWVAARALGMERVGRIAPGFRADLAIWDADHPAQLCYWFGAELCRTRVVAGTLADADTSA